MLETGSLCTDSYSDKQTFFFKNANNLILDDKQAFCSKSEIFNSYYLRF